MHIFVFLMFMILVQESETVLHDFPHGVQEVIKNSVTHNL